LDIFVESKFNFLNDKVIVASKNRGCGW